MTVPSLTAHGYFLDSEVTFFVIFGPGICHSGEGSSAIYLS